MRNLLLALLAAAPLAPLPAAAQDAPAPDAAVDVPENDARVRLRGVQKRLFLKARRHELDLMGGALAPDALDTAVTYGGAYTFHLTEEVGLEGSVLWAKAHSRVIDAVQRFGFQDRVVFFDGKPFAYYQGDVVLTPIHGKLLLFADKIVHFDIALCVGVGASGSRTASGLSMNAGVSLKFFLASWLSLRFDVRDYVHREEILDVQGVANDLGLTAGVGFWFPFRS